MSKEDLEAAAAAFDLANQYDKMLAADATPIESEEPIILSDDIAGDNYDLPDEYFEDFSSDFIDDGEMELSSFS